MMSFQELVGAWRTEDEPWTTCRLVDVRSGGILVSRRDEVVVSAATNAYHSGRRLLKKCRCTTVDERGQSDASSVKTSGARPGRAAACSK